MEKVAIPKIEYDRLKREASAYRKFATHFFESAVRDPIYEVVEDFQRTNLYTKEFLEDLEDGLRKSSYSKTHGTKAHKTGSRRLSSQISSRS